MIDLTIFTVATGRYLDFWIQLVQSGEEFLDKSVRTQWLVLTDQAKGIPLEISNMLGPRLTVTTIDHEPWPFPTLKRYQYLRFASAQITGDFLMHLDADMLFVAPVNETDILSPLASSDVACVSHPGFFRPGGFNRLTFYARNPRKVIQDAILLFQFGGIGTWERNSDSTAYVPRSHRREYVCGGCWFGTKKGVLSMAEALKHNIEIDLETPYIASFHDESHLNAYIADRQITILTPEFCFDPKYPQLINVTPKILAVDKNRTSKWER